MFDLKCQNYVITTVDVRIEQTSVSNCLAMPNIGVQVGEVWTKECLKEIFVDPESLMD